MVWNWLLEAPGVSFTFGDDDALFVVDRWGVQPGKLRTTDRANVRFDGVRFGRDYRSGQSIDFSMWTRTVGDEAAALSMLAAAQAAWRGEDGRIRAGGMARLHHPNGRFVYGRPRGFSFDPNRVERGIILASAVFECVDDLWYGPAVSTRVRFSIPESGGLTFPAEAPFTFDSGPTQRNGVLVVGGEVETLPVFVIQGPVVNPSINVTGVGELQLSVTLAYDQTLTVDCRNGWTKRDGSPLPGAVSPRGARLKDMALKPGSYEVVLRGYDPTGTGYLDVQVEPAFTTF